MKMLQDFSGSPTQLLHSKSRLWTLQVFFSSFWAQLFFFLKVTRLLKTTCWIHSTFYKSSSKTSFNTTVTPFVLQFAATRTISHRPHKSTHRRWVQKNRRSGFHFTKMNPIWINNRSENFCPNSRPEEAVGWNRAMGCDGEGAIPTQWQRKESLLFAGLSKLPFWKTIQILQVLAYCRRNGHFSRSQSALAASRVSASAALSDNREIPRWKKSKVNRNNLEKMFFSPRFGLIRGRQFLMNDMYSFDVDVDSCQKTYSLVTSAYRRIFKDALQLDIRTVVALTQKCSKSSIAGRFRSWCSWRRNFTWISPGE